MEKPVIGMLSDWGHSCVLKLLLTSQFFATVGCYFCWTMSFFMPPGSHRLQEAGRNVGTDIGSRNSPEPVKSDEKINEPSQAARGWDLP